MGHSRSVSELADLAKDDPQRIWEHQSATRSLEKLCRQRSLLDERIAFAKGRIKVAENRLARELLRQVAP
jgi:hypothetical protein